MTTKNINHHQIIKQIGKRLFTLALFWSRNNMPHTKKDLREQFENIKGRKKWHTKKATYEHAEIVRDLANTLSMNRQFRNPSRGKNQGSRSNILGHSKPAVLPRGTLKERADRRKQELILKAAGGKTPEYSGVTETLIRTGTPNATTTTSRGEQYSTRCTYHKTDAVHTIVIPADWYSSVYRRGLDQIDGMLTLDAEPIASDGYTIYKAIWMRTKGKQILAESGYIAIGEHGAAHARTENGAKAVLTRRANEIKHSRREARIRKALHDMQLSGYDDVIVTISDSLCAGNCEPGTLEFRDRHFPNQNSATVAEILAVGSMRTLAINACLRAIRRAKINHQLSA